MENYEIEKTIVFNKSFWSFQKKVFHVPRNVTKKHKGFEEIVSETQFKFQIKKIIC